MVERYPHKVEFKVQLMVKRQPHKSSVNSGNSHEVAAVK